jgi:hypothetical protein
MGEHFDFFAILSSVAEQWVPRRKVVLHVPEEEMDRLR